MVNYKFITVIIHTGPKVVTIVKRVRMRYADIFDCDFIHYCETAENNRDPMNINFLRMSNMAAKRR